MVQFRVRFVRELFIVRFMKELFMIFFIVRFMKEFFIDSYLHQNLRTPRLTRLAGTACHMVRFVKELFIVRFVKELYLSFTHSGSSMILFIVRFVKEFLFKFHPQKNQKIKISKYNS